jgi:hypothetical protein
VRRPPCWSRLLKIGESLHGSELRFASTSFDGCTQDSKHWEHLSQPESPLNAWTEEFAHCTS